LKKILFQLSRRRKTKYPLRTKIIVVEKTLLSWSQSPHEAD
jgi:hypothetical protein